MATTLPLPTGIKSRIINNGNGLDMHVLEAGEEPPQKPLLLLLHGFPELSYSFRKIIVPLSRHGSGYHVVAPDQRGYGRTTGWDQEDLNSFKILNLVADIVGLVQALGYQRVHCVVGHDFGSSVAAFCALIRPDIFRSVIMMSAPFGGPPAFAASAGQVPSPLDELNRGLASLNPPRKHYATYFAPPCFEANSEMLQALPLFLRAYFHVKSADWTGNDPHPHPLSSFTATELAVLPEYYIMQAHNTMAQTVLPHLPEQEAPWLTDLELLVYVEEFKRTTFQGGLNWYHNFVSPQTELRVFAGRKIDVPGLFVAGEKDWGMYQVPGALERMQNACRKMGQGMEGIKVVKDAGHWVQQEMPDKVVDIILDFISRCSAS